MCYSKICKGAWLPIDKRKPSLQASVYVACPEQKTKEQKPRKARKQAKQLWQVPACGKKQQSTCAACHS